MKPKSRVLIVFLLLAFATNLHADDRVKKLTPEHRKWLEQDAVYIITDREKDVFLSLAGAEQRNWFIEAFWERRDPNPATLENEFKIEHHRRIAYANKYLSRDAPRPGWRTDRGRFYIILGEPQSIQRYDGLNEVVSSEIWYYPGEPRLGLPPRFNLLFFKDNDIGEYELYHPLADGPEALLRAGVYFRADQNRAVDALEIVDMDLAIASITVDLTELSGHLLAGRSSRQPLTSYVRVSLTVDSTLANIVESPKKRVDTGYIDGHLRYGDKVSAEYSFRYVPNRSYFAVLTGPKETPFVHYSIELDPENFSLEMNEEKTRLYTTLDVNLEIRDLEGNLVAVNENAVFLELAPSELERVQAHPYAYQDDFPLVVPGKYNVSVTLRNRLTKQFTVVEKEVHIEPLAGKPGLSSIILGYKNELIAGATSDVFKAYQIGQNRIHPSTGNVFSLGETVHVFSQVLGGGPDHRLRFAILNNDEPLLERETILADYHGGPVMEEFFLRGMVGGHYRLRVQLLDPAGTIVAEKSSPLTVSPRASIPRPEFVSWYSFNTEVPGALSLMRGEQLFFFGRLEEARTELEEAVAANNLQLPAATWKLATVLLHMREADRALELLLPLKDQYPDEYEVVEGLGLAYYFKDDYPPAVTYLEKAMTIRPPDISVLNALGYSYQQLRRVEEAKQVFERSLKLKPEQSAIKRWLTSLGEGGSR